MLTPTNLARLAAWCKMSHATHPDIFSEPYIYCDVYGITSIEWIPLDPPNLPDPTDPGADQRDVDRVWLADVWHTLATSHEWDTEGFDLYLTDTGDLGVVLSPRIYEADIKPANECASSATLALLLAARAAGVPEVVAAMGDEG